MGTWQRIVTAIALLAMGIAGAWPFRTPAGEEASSLESRAPVLALRRSGRGEARGAESASVERRRNDVSSAEVGASANRASRPGADDTAASLQVASVARQVRRVERPQARPAMAASFSAAVGRPVSDLMSGGVGWPVDRSRAERRHTIRDGDTLEAISRRHYGDARYAGFLFQHNRDVLRRPDLLPLGAVLRIPAHPESSATRVESRAATEDAAGADQRGLDLISLE